MGTDWIPGREAELLVKMQTLSTALTAGPTVYVLPTGLAADFAEQLGILDARYATCQNEVTRSPANITAKNEAKASVIRLARQINKILQADVNLSDFNKQAAGLPVYSTSRAPLPPPQSAPVIENFSIFGNRASYEVHGTSSLRGKEHNAHALSAFYYIGETAPTSVEGWVFVESTTKNKVVFDLPEGTAPNTKVWVTCFWVGARSQSSAACQPVYSYTTHAAPVPMPPAMKKAA